MEFRNLDTLFGHVLRTGETVIANDAPRDPRAGGIPPGHPPLDAFLGIPLSAGDRLVAMVGLANQPGGYSQADVDFLQPLLGAVRQMVLAWRAQPTGSASARASNCRPRVPCWQKNRRRCN